LAGPDGLTVAVRVTGLLRKVLLSSTRLCRSDHLLVAHRVPFPGGSCTRFRCHELSPSEMPVSQRRKSEATHQQQNQEDHHDHANDTTRAIAPGPAVAPGWITPSSTRMRMMRRMVPRLISELPLRPRLLCPPSTWQLEVSSAAFQNIRNGARRLAFARQSSKLACHDRRSDNAYLGSSAP
jgi:hypothetical protein